MGYYKNLNIDGMRGRYTIPLTEHPKFQQCTPEEAAELLTSYTGITKEIKARLAFLRWDGTIASKIYRCRGWNSKYAILLIIIVMSNYQTFPLTFKLSYVIIYVH